MRRDCRDSIEGCILDVYVNVAFSKRTVWKGLFSLIYSSFVLHFFHLASYRLRNSTNSSTVFAADSGSYRYGNLSAFEIKFLIWFWNLA